MLTRHNIIRVGKGILPILVLGLAIGLLLSFGCGDDGKETEGKAKATGASYTGMYTGTAANFEGTCLFGCGDDDPPTSDCPEFDMLLVQDDGDIMFTFLAGTIYYDGSFALSETFMMGGSGTMEITITGAISANTIEGSASLVVEGATFSCNHSFDFSGPVTTNATVTVNGFTGYNGKNVYAFVFEVTPFDPVALGGGELTNGSVTIDLKPTLPDGPYTLAVVVDADGNIVESFTDVGDPVSDGDWVAMMYPFTISSGSGSDVLNKQDDFCEWPSCP